MTAEEKRKKAEEKAREKMDAWSKNPEDVIEVRNYDFRKDVVVFGDEEEIDKYIIYQAVGLWEKGYQDTEWIDEWIKKYNGKEIDEQEDKILIPRGEADSCPLMQLIYKKLWDKGDSLIGDTMNSGKTTLNLLIKKELVDTEQIDLTTAIDDLIKKKRQPWSIWKTVSQYSHDLGLIQYHEGEEIIIKKALEKREKIEGTIREELKKYKDVERFLGAVYTIGNFIPVPKIFNNRRGFNNCYIKDYWDLTLKCIYDWYDASSRDKAQSFLAKLLNYNDNGIRVCSDWLGDFGRWDDFVEQNFLQDYTERQERPYGRPNEFWDGHFDGVPLPVTHRQFEDFFTHATDCITARSERMARAFGKKLQQKKSHN